MAIYPKKFKIDMLSVSGHKIHGPKGTGFLYINEKVKITDFYCFYQDYSTLADEWEPILNSLNYSKTIKQQENYTKEWWMENTFFSEFDSLSSWYYDEEEGRPNLKICE